jgi:hypothetical protein
MALSSKRDRVVLTFSPDQNTTAMLQIITDDEMICCMGFYIKLIYLLKKQTISANGTDIQLLMFCCFFCILYGQTKK